MAVLPITRHLTQMCESVRLTAPMQQLGQAPGVSVVLEIGGRTASSGEFRRPNSNFAVG